MLFHSAIFALFLSLVLPFYWLLRGSRARKLLLVLASYLFYASWDWRYLGLLFLSTAVDAVVARRIFHSDSPRSRRGWLLASLATNLGVLATFKYGNLFLETLDPLQELLGVSIPRLPGQIPVGISFYTFQTLSYTIDVYRRRLEPYALLDFSMYVAFFPQLVAGPIVRARDFLPQIVSMKAPTWENVAAGSQRFVWGLFKKMVIADNVGLFVDTVFAAPGQLSAVTLWCGAAGFALQIYCDFSGYTDMALGLGRMFGIRLPENFNAPYLARSITEFWRRWHMSLSSWLRDYLYISLGGSRGSRLLTYRNLMITMALGGLWHGAAWTFVIWGAAHGALLIAERAFHIGREEVPGHLRNTVDALRAAITLVLVCLTWVIFRAESFELMGIQLSRMFTEWAWLDRGEALGLRWLAALAVLVIGQHLSLRYEWRARVWDRLHPAAQGFGLAALLMLVAAFRVDDVAFIYFQF